MLFIILLITVYDSMPPLPDLAESEFPEPALWVEPLPSSLCINGFAGQFSGVAVDLGISSFSLEGNIIRENKWDSTDMGNASLSYSISLPRLWIQPQLHALSFKRDRLYQKINPRLGLRILAPSFIIGGSFDFTRWLVENETVHETTGDIFLGLDRLSFVPQLALTGIYTDRLLKPGISAQLNIGYFHLKFGSVLRAGFPSPDISITYAEPWVRISTNVRTGVRYNTLTTLFDPELPVEYPTIVEAETLGLAADLMFEFSVREQKFRVGSSYKEWVYRLNIDDYYLISGMRDVQEINLTISAQNQLDLGKFQILNKLHFSYNKSDSTIVFLPGYAINDTFSMNIGIFELTGDIKRFSRRSGIGEDLPVYYRINTAAGLKLLFLKLYVAIDNITDNTSEIYDNYFLTGRKYAAGIEFEKKL
jgi:hypothetical protein